MIKSILLGCFILLCCASYGQNTRIRDNNTIGWAAITATIPVKNKWSLHTEYQWRRDGFVNNWQQSLLRTGINYRVNDKLTLRAGYAWAETFNYGDIPINAFGKQFTEHRVYEMASLTDQFKTAGLIHRFMLEQRWIGRYSDASLDKEDDYFFVNRFRYMFRMQVPLNNKTITAKTLYAVLYDEIFLGFGKNVNENVFDQNRVGLLAGYRFSPGIAIEAGFLSQVAQLPREVNGQNVFQYNNGIILSASINL